MFKSSRNICEVMETENIRDVNETWLNGVELENAKMNWNGKFKSKSRGLSEFVL